MLVCVLLLTLVGVAATTFRTTVDGMSCLDESDKENAYGPMDIYAQAWQPGYVTLDWSYRKPSEEMMDKYYLFDECQDRNTLREKRCVNGQVETTTINCTSLHWSPRL